MEGIWANTKAKGKGLWDWIKNNWGLLLAGLVLLFTPLTTLVKAWDTFMEMSWWEKALTAAVAAGVLLNSGSILKWIGTSVVGIFATMTAALTTWFQGTAFAKALSASFIPNAAGRSTGANMIGGAMILGALALAIKDGIAGSKLSETWGVGKAEGVAGAVIGGTESGLKGAMSNMGKWALIGAGLGSFFPVVGTLIGGLIGGAVGALLGWIGGEKIANFFEKPGEHFKKLWDTMLNGIEIFIDDIRIYFIDPILNIFAGITKWSKDIFKKIAPPWLLKIAGEEPSQTKDDTTGEFRPQKQDAATKNVLIHGGEAELKSQREKLVTEFESGVDPARKAQIDRDIVLINKKLGIEPMMPATLTNSAFKKSDEINKVHNENMDLEAAEKNAVVINNIDNSKKSSSSAQETTLVTQPSAIHIISQPTTSFIPYR